MDAYRRNNQQKPPVNRTRSNQGTIPLVIERTVSGSSHGNVVNVSPVLELIEVDHHFVPTKGGSAEDLQIKYDILGYSNQEVKLRISNANHTPNVVYERPLTDEERSRGRGKIIKWNGATNCTTGQLQGKLINPMFGKYKVELVSQTKKSKELYTHVIFREIKLELMSWEDVFYAATKLPADQFPFSGTLPQKNLWFQHKLNKLNYFAGAPNDNKSFYRGLFRYTQEHPQFPKLYDFETFDSKKAPGDCLWGWFNKWKTSILNPHLRDIVKSLTENKNPHAKVLEVENLSHKNYEEKPGDNILSDNKLYVDHNIFYQNKDFAEPDAHAAYDAEFCNRPVLPLKVKALLLSRTDADASKPGVDSPEAVGEFECEWKVFDPPEDISLVPPPARNSKLRSKARTYIDTVHRKLDGKYGDALNPQDNCPKDYGGFRPTAAADSTPFFGAIAPAFPSSVKGGTRFFSKANVDSTYRAGIFGINGVVFQGSYIAGDNYVIQACLSFDNHPKGDELKTIHTDVEKLKPSFESKEVKENKVINKSDLPKHSLISQSGKLTIWRRTAVSHILDFGPSDYPPIEWAKVSKIYRAAHIKLDFPKEGVRRLGDLLDNTAKDNVANAIFEGAKKITLDDIAKWEVDRCKSISGFRPTFNPDGFYTLPLLNLVDFEKNDKLFNKAKAESGALGSTPAERFQRYTSYIAKIIKDYPKYDYMLDAALEIRKAIDRLNLKPGLIILRTAYLPKPDWNTLLPADVKNATVREQEAFDPYRGVSTGMDYGVIFLDKGQYKIYTDEFFYSHEISHCLFGSHAFEEVSFDDHDRSDSNCIMYYSKNNMGVFSGWGMRKSTAPEYTLNLEIEVWKEKPNWNGSLTNAEKFEGSFLTGVESPGNLTGKFKKEKDSAKVWSITGSVETIQKALNEVQFQPSVKLKDKKAAKQDGLKITMVAKFPVKNPPDLAEMKSSEGMFPLTRQFNDKAGKETPFKNLKLEPIRLEDNEPRFCGKCILKLRGWRIRQLASTAPVVGVTPPAILPEKSPAVPVNGKMFFNGYTAIEGDVLFTVAGKDKMVKFGLKAKDPDNPKIPLGPFSFEHDHTFTWESSSGNLNDLRGLITREVVLWDAPTQNTPFNKFADPDQRFAQTGGGGQDGSGGDKHSMRQPALICERDSNGVPVAGKITARQSYQYCVKPGVYSKNPDDWVEIADSQFLLEKEVYFDEKSRSWIMMFRKTNLSPNEVPFLFEAHYKIGPQLSFTPDLTANQFAGATQDVPKINGDPLVQQMVWAAGDQTLNIKYKSLKSTEVTVEELIKSGIMIKGSPITKR